MEYEYRKIVASFFLLCDSTRIFKCKDMWIFRKGCKGCAFRSLFVHRIAKQICGWTSQWYWWGARTYICFATSASRFFVLMRWFVIWRLRCVRRNLHLDGQGALRLPGSIPSSFLAHKSFLKVTRARWLQSSEAHSKRSNVLCTCRAQKPILGGILRKAIVIWVSRPNVSQIRCSATLF